MDKVRPTIIVTYPHNCEKDVSIYRTIKILFHEPYMGSFAYPAKKVY